MSRLAALLHDRSIHNGIQRRSTVTADYSCRKLAGLALHLLGDSLRCEGRMP